MKAMDRWSWTARGLAAIMLAWLVGGSGTAGFAQSPVPPRKVIVQDVIPQGSKQISAQRIMTMVQTKPGKELDSETLKEDVSRLYKTKLFANVQSRVQPVGEDRVIVHFDLAELPSVVQDVIYKGNKHMKDDELSKLTNIRKGAPLNPILNKSACQAILRAYQEKNRLLASVDLEEGDKPGDTRVVFNITEGPIVRVRSIDFTGNTFVTQARLRTQLNSSAMFLGLFGAKFDPKVADLDVSKLEEYYRAFGFHDVRVSRELQWDAALKHVTLVFHINEGPRYRVGNITLVGNQEEPTDKLLGMTKMRTGELYDERVVASDIQTIGNFYGHKGQQVVPAKNIVRSQRPGEVDINIELRERQTATVGQIIIVGNEVTRQNVILRQIPLYPGQVLSYPDLRVAENNLARLNIFDINPEQGIRPTLTVLDPDSDNPVKDIMVTVKETTTGSLLFGAGINSNAGFTGSIVLNERNFDILNPPLSLADVFAGRAFRGGGQEFRMEAVPGTELQRYTISWREPFLFDSPFSLGTSAYYYTRRYLEFDERRVGGRLTVGRRLNQYWSASATARLEQVDVRNVPFYAPSDFLDVRGTSTLFGLRASISRDSRDSFMRATQGSYVEASFEQVLGDFSYPLINVEANKYFTVYQRPDGSGRHVLALRSQLGWAGTQTPVYERFYAGGFRSLRGFEFRGVGPSKQGFMVGGDFMFLNSAEYQVPILANDQLYAVAFLDSGTVESRASFKDYRLTAGAGLRIIVPMMGPVPIALDFGFPIVKAAGDREQIFSFWLGFFH